MSKRMFTEDQENMIRRIYASGGVSMSSLARVFKCSPTTIKYTIDPECRAKVYEQQRISKAAKRKMKATPAPKHVPETVRQLTLEEVVKRAENGAKTINGTIHNATIDDIATLNDLFDVTFTVHFR